MSQKNAKPNLAMPRSLPAAKARRSAPSPDQFGAATVARWVERAKGSCLDHIEWSDRPCTPHKTQRSKASLEDRVLAARRLGWHQIRF